MLPADIRRQSWGAAGLLMLGLPIGPSADFYLGYPLRTLAATIADWTLGPAVWREGNGLTDGNALLFVDAPCSGLRMLTVGIAMACLLAAFLRHTPLRFLLLLSAALILTILGNAARAMLLFMLERQGLLSSSTDMWTGLLIFGTCALLLVGLALRLSASETLPARPKRPRVFLHRIVKPLWLLSLSIALVASASGSGLWPSDKVEQIQEDAVPAWPTHWEGRRLVPVSFDPETARFLENFPGAMAEFELEGTGKRILLRITDEATRRMHPAEHCYAATGWTCTPSPALFQDDSGLWNTFTAARAGTIQQIRQCYFHLAALPTSTDLQEWIQGQPNWPDVSSWWWAAARGKSGGCYLAVTVSEGIR
jgi:exosortase/archaeosortase family protein